MAFFDLAREKGLVVEKVLETKLEKPMFEKDRGDREMRRLVLGFEMRWGEGGGVGIEIGKAEKE